MSLGEDAVERLREIGLFGGLSDEALRELSSKLDVVELEPGGVVYREGESGREMFIVLEGQLEVVRRSKRGSEVAIAVLGQGTWFGEKSVLDVMHRPSTVRALAASRLLRVTAHDLDGLYRRDLKSYTLVVLNIAREMSRQLRVAEGMLTDLVATFEDEYVRPR
jgi:CRP-like cAMP-binding protein